MIGYWVGEDKVTGQLWLHDSGAENDDSIDEVWLFTIYGWGGTGMCKVNRKEFRQRLKAASPEKVSEATTAYQAWNNKMSNDLSPSWETGYYDLGVAVSSGHRVSPVRYDDEWPLDDDYPNA